MSSSRDVGDALRQRWRRTAHVGECLAELQDEAPEAGEARAGYLLALAELGDQVWSNRRWVVETYVQAFEADPRDPRPLGRALTLALEMRRPEIVVELAALELRATSDEARRQALRVLLGTTLLDLGRREEASPVLSAALVQTPEDEGIQALAAICHDELDWSEEVVRLVTQVTKATRKVAATLCLRAARILSLERPGGPAYEKLLGRAASIEPVDEGAVYL